MTATPTAPTPAQDADQPLQRASDLDPRLLVDEAGLAGYVTAFRRRLAGGELGSLPVVIGLLVIALVFYTQQPAFLSAENLSNLVLQMIAVGTISLGIVMVLLLGEVDLSVGSISGVTAALFATQVVNHGRSQVLGFVLALLLGTAIGGFQGFFFTRFGVPSFVVTLAGLLGWQGLQLKVLGTTGSVNVTDGFVHSLTGAFYPPTTGWLLAVIAVLLYAGVQLVEVRARSGAGLRPRPVIEVVTRCIVLAIVLGIGVAVLNRYRGVPFALVLFLVLVVLFDLLIRRTRYGRHVLAVGGNAEAARRAGISVAGIRLSVFMIAGLMAALGGILNTSYLQSVDQSSGGSNTLLYAIAAAVIGGTSLFGGRGSIIGSVLGAMIVGVFITGLSLAGVDDYWQKFAAGTLVIVAVALDQWLRRASQ